MPGCEVLAEHHAQRIGCLVWGLLGSDGSSSTIVFSPEKVQICASTAGCARYRNAASAGDSALNITANSAIAATRLRSIWRNMAVGILRQQQMRVNRKHPLTRYIAADPALHAPRIHIVCIFHVQHIVFLQAHRPRYEPQHVVQR